MLPLPLVIMVMYMQVAPSGKRPTARQDAIILPFHARFMHRDRRMKRDAATNGRRGPRNGWGDIQYENSFPLTVLFGVCQDAELG